MMHSRLALIAMVLSAAFCLQVKGTRWSYIVSEGKMNWYEAKTFCSQRGGHLATAGLDDATLLRGVGITRFANYWLGFTDKASEGVWRGVDGRLDIIRWSPKQPDNWGGNEHCLGMYGSDEQIRMNDFVCEFRGLHAFCQLDKDDCNEALVGKWASGYRGCQTMTRSGKVCQAWNSQSPHKHSRTAKNYPDKGLGAYNYCRNPDEEDTIWCYTNDKNERWDYCYPVAKGKWTDWVSIGCTSSCGAGTETFVRLCAGPGKCQGDYLMYKPCKNLPQCASWTEWESQGCSVICGEGSHKYTRTCVGAGECIGDDTKYEPCQDIPKCSCPPIASPPLFYEHIQARYPDVESAYRDCLTDEIPDSVSCTLSCESGFEVAGVKSISCNDGSWSGSLGTCLRLTGRFFAGDRYYADITHVSGDEYKWTWTLGVSWTLTKTTESMLDSSLVVGEDCPWRGAPLNHTTLKYMKGGKYILGPDAGDWKFWRHLNVEGHFVKDNGGKGVSQNASDYIKIEHRAGDEYYWTNKAGWGQGWETFNLINLGTESLMKEVLYVEPGGRYEWSGPDNYLRFMNNWEYLLGPSNEKYYRTTPEGTWGEWKSQGCSASCGVGYETYVRSCEGPWWCTEGHAKKSYRCIDLPKCKEMVKPRISTKFRR